LIPKNYLLLENYIAYEIQKIKSYFVILSISLIASFVLYLIIKKTNIEEEETEDNIW
jgi:phosphotransferase system  glucose/maltose/N-acetylglucosamine-specific IIC component